MRTKCVKGTFTLRFFLQALLGVGGNIVTKGEEKAEVLNAFFASIFNSKTSCSLGTPKSRVDIDDVDGEQNEAPVIQGKKVT